MELELNKDFWEKRYESNETGWDLGQVSPPLKSYFDQLANKALNILIPGCGNAHEAAYLINRGFQNVYLVDIAKEPLESFAKSHPNFPKQQLINDDFFKIDQKFDLIIEQTFFCALDPKLRAKYAKQMAELLHQGGKLVGVLFDDQLNDDKPPFGGNKTEYLTYFEPYFEVEIMEPCHNSINPRAGRELFIKLVKK